jgi:hypothetical protein
VKKDMVLEVIILNTLINENFLAMSWLMQLVAGLLLWRARFLPMSVHVGFVVDIVALG